MLQIYQLNIEQKVGLKKNDDARGMYNTNSQTKFKNLILKLNLCDHIAYTLVNGTIIVAE